MQTFLPRTPRASCLSHIVRDLCELVPACTPATAADLRMVAQLLLRGPGHVVGHLLQHTTPHASGVCAAVLEYLATSEHCCDRGAVAAMLDARVAELIAASLHCECDAHLQRQACRLLAAVAYQLGSAVPFEDEESCVAQRLFPDAIVAALVAYMQRNIGDSMQFTMALTAVMKGVCDQKVATRFNWHGLAATLEAALAHGHTHSDEVGEVRVLRFLWQFAHALPDGERLPSRTLAHTLLQMLPRTAESAWAPSDYVRLSVLTCLMRWTTDFPRKTLKCLRSLCVSVLTHAVTPETVLRCFCCLYVFSILCLFKTPECALEGAGMPGHGIAGKVLDEMTGIKSCEFWTQTIECYEACLRLPTCDYNNAWQWVSSESSKQQRIAVQGFLRQQCFGDILSKFVKPGVCTAQACVELLSRCSVVARKAPQTAQGSTVHHLHLVTVSVQSALSPASVVMAALDVVRSCAPLAAGGQHRELSSTLLLEIVVSMHREHLCRAELCRAAVDSLDCIVRGGSAQDARVRQDSSAASLGKCVENDRHFLVQQEEARLMLDFFAKNLVSLAGCDADARFAALVCHCIRAPEDITTLLMHGLNVAYVIEFFGVKVTEACAFFGIWLLAGLLGACVEKHVPMPSELESLLCSIGARRFARTLHKLEAAAISGRIATPLAFSLYFWHLLVAAVDKVFDEHARAALAAAAEQCNFGVSKRFEEMLAEALNAREELRREERASARKKADALLEELVREEQTGGRAGKGRRSRRQRRAAKGVAASGELPSAAGAVGAAVSGARAVDATDVQAIMYRRPYTSSPVVMLDNSPSVSESPKLNAGESPSDPGLRWRSWPDLRILQDSPLVSSDFLELRDLGEARVAFRGIDDMLPSSVPGRVHVVGARARFSPCGSFCNGNFNRVDQQTASAPPQPQAAGAQTGAEVDLPGIEGMDYSQSTLATYLHSTQATFAKTLDLRYFSTEAKQFLTDAFRYAPKEPFMLCVSKRNYCMQATVPRPLNLHGFSAMAIECLLQQLSGANSRSSLASSAFADSRLLSADLVGFRGGDRLQSSNVAGQLGVLQSPCPGAGVHSTSPFKPTLGLESQQRLQIVEACAAENEDKCVRAMASDDSAQAGGHAGTQFAECVVCLEEIEKEKLVVLVPCGHVCVCKKCASPMASCPICRANVQQVVTPFYS